MTPPIQDRSIKRFRVEVRTASRDLTHVWRTADHTRRGWRIRGLVLGPRLADPAIAGDYWVAWAQGREDEPAIEGTGARPELAVHDLVKRLRASR